MAKLRDLILQLEDAVAPTRKVSKHEKPEPRKSSAPVHHTPNLANKHSADTQAPTRKVDKGALPKSGKSTAGVGRHLKPGEKMVFGRIVKAR